jgi:serralysin
MQPDLGQYLQTGSSRFLNDYCFRDETKMSKSLFSSIVLAPLVLILNGVSALPANGQPPNIDRWAGGTALTQPQGFGQGAPLRLTWGFIADGVNIPNAGFGAGPSNLRARLNGIYGSQAAWQPLFASVFDRWSSISGLSYTFEANDDGAAFVNSVGVANVRADIRIGGKALDGNSGVLAYNYFPDVGDMVIDTNDNFYNTTSGGSLRLRNVVAHEHGHGVGMEHVLTDNDQLMNPFFNDAFDGPQHHDILVAQRGYGDFHEKGSGGLGNDVFSRATALGNVANGGSVSVGNSARTLTVAPGATDFVSIDDTSDTDFWSFTVGSAGMADISLEALGFTYTAAPQSGGISVLFNTEQRSDLSLSLFATNGTTLLASSNSTGLGGDEFINDFNLTSAGTYFVRVTGLNNADFMILDTQFYGLRVAFTAIPEAGSLAMLALGSAICMVRRRKRQAV